MKRQNEKIVIVWSVSAVFFHDPEFNVLAKNFAVDCPHAEGTDADVQGRFVGCWRRGTVGN